MRCHAPQYGGQTDFLSFCCYLHRWRRESTDQLNHAVYLCTSAEYNGLLLYFCSISALFLYFLSCQPRSHLLISQQAVRTRQFPIPISGFIISTIIYHLDHHSYFYHNHNNYHDDA